MTIRLLEGIQLAGIHQAVGSILTLAPDVEARHVSSNKAVYTTLPDIGDDSVELRGKLNKVTGGSEISISGKNVSSDIGANPQAGALVKPSKLQEDYGNPVGVFGYTAATATLDKTFVRFGNYSRKLDISAATGQIRASNRTITCDPDDKMLSIDIYIPFMTVQGAGGHSINVEVTNEASLGSNRIIFSFDSAYLRQGWNSLRMWEGDTNGASGTGTLAAGATKSIAGTGCNMAAAIGSVYITFNNFTGKSVYLDGIRRAAKVKPILVMGFDATGTDTTDNVFTEKVAPLFAAYGYQGYFTVTNVYDVLYTGSTDDLRKRTLYRDFGWDALVHTWNHGATAEGSSATVTAAVVSDLVTVAYPVAHLKAIGSKWHASIGGATPAACNGVFEMTATTTTAFSYTATGAGTGAVTGTITYSTKLEDVVAAESTLATNIVRHEVADMASVMRSIGFNRGSTIGAWPNNSCPELVTTKAVCDASGVRLFRGIKGGTVKVNELGIDNPLQFGSYEMGSGTTATSLQYLKDKLVGAIGRGEHMWTYGHYILDDTNPANAAYIPVDNTYAPGVGSNPNPPAAGAQGGTGGWWYYSTLKRWLDEAVVPAVSAGQIAVMRPSDFSRAIGVSL